MVKKKKNLTRSRDGEVREEEESGEQRGFEEVLWSEGVGDDESFFQVVCSPEAAVVPDGLRLRGSRVCINIYSYASHRFLHQDWGSWGGGILGTQEASTHVDFPTGNEARRQAGFTWHM